MGVVVDDERRCRRRWRKKRRRRAVAIPAMDPMTMPAIAPLERWLLELGVGEGRLEVGVARFEEDVDDEDVAYK